MKKAFDNGRAHFLEMSGGGVNATELVASLINEKQSISEGIRYAQESIDGSMSMLVMTQHGIFAAKTSGKNASVHRGERRRTLYFL